MPISEQKEGAMREGKEIGGGAGSRSSPGASRLVRIPREEHRDAVARGIRRGLGLSSSLAIQNCIRWELWSLLEKYGINPFQPMAFQYQDFDCHWMVEGAATAPQAPAERLREAEQSSHSEPEGRRDQK
jgi:hypothetical protein